MALIVRKWKGKDYHVLALSDVSLAFLADLTSFHFPDHLRTEDVLRTHVSEVSLRKRISAELIEAMIAFRLVEEAIASKTILE
jgi:hypothetical protein